MKNSATIFWRKYLKINFILYFLLAFAMLSCSKDDLSDNNPPPNETAESSAKQISSFVFLLTNNPINVNVVATIDESNKTITASMPAGTQITGLLPEIQLSPLATVDRISAQDFTNPLQYTVTAEDGSTMVYTVTITALLSQRQILQAILDANPGNTLDWDLQNTADLGTLNRVFTDVAGNIIELDLGGASLPQIPPQIGQLTNLTVLKLSVNNISLLPPEIGQLTSLANLQLHNNQLSTLPPEIVQLTSLTRLNLSQNQLSTLPPEIVQLTSLTRLDLSINQLSTLPPEIGQLTSLTSLYLYLNQLSTLPPEIGLLTSLTDLDIGNNQLSNLPPEIGLLTSLTILDIRNNQLSNLPPEIGFLTNLEDLDITLNNLTEIPISVVFLAVHGTSSLAIHNDSGVSAAITSQKDALISMYSSNPGNTLGWSVGDFPEVTFNGNGNPIVISMNNKNLTRIPSAIAALSDLETLNANGNNLESLPPNLGSINTLGVIAVANNNLSTVPFELGQLTNLGLLSLTQNPITSIPQEVCDLQTSNGGILTILTDPGEECN